MELLPVGLGSVVPLTAGVPVAVGRLNYSVHDTRISRQHVTARLSHQGAAESITITALKPVFVEHSGGATTKLTQLSQGQTCQLHIGDIVYLLKTGSGYEAGFRLQCRANPVQLALDPDSTATHSHATAADEPAPKRHKAAAASVSTAPNKMSAAAAAATPSNGSGGPFRAAIAAAAEADGCQQAAVLTSRSASAEAQMQNMPSDPQTGPLFAGVRLVDWDGHHTQMAVKKAAEERADVTLWLDDTTTHVIARYELTADEVQRRLAAQAQKQQRQQRHTVAPKQPSPKSQHRHQQQQQQQQQPLADKLGPGSPGDWQESQPGSQHGQQQQQQQRQLEVAQHPDGQLAISKQLPPGVQFVTVSWITDSLKSRCRLPEEQFHTDLQQRLQRSRSGAHTRLPSPAAPVLLGAGDKPSNPPPHAAAAGGGDDDAPVSGTNIDRPNRATMQGSQQQQQQQQSPGSVQRRLQKQQVVVPVPADVCPADTPWGTGDRWIEPWNDDAALESMERLMAHWYQTTARHSNAAAAATATGAPGSTHSSASSRGGSAMIGPGDPHELSLAFSNHQQQQQLPSQQRQQEQQVQQRQHISAAGAVDSGGGGGGGVAPCDHMACSQQSFCLVEEMERLKRNYHGRSDQFRIKAASRAIQELERLQQPIIGPQDIEAMPIGEKSKQKLQEILQTGRLRRNDVLESSELHKTMQLFMTVWGCADSTARKWWAEGCRSLDDVRHKASGLTAIQQMGLRYYDDFERRIPRAEVAEAVAIIRDTTLDVLEGITGKPREELSHLLHVRALGSYVRGKQDTGDIDILLAAGPAAEDVPPGTLAAALLHQLQDKGYVPEGLSLDHRGASLETAVRVSWMGVWKGPTSPCYRRLDIKTYERAALPYAVNYFSSGQDGSRALRYWCNKPRPEVAALAAAVHSAANAFHMSDTGLYVVYNAQLPPASSAAIHRQNTAVVPLLKDAMAGCQQGGAVASTAIHRVHTSAGDDGLSAATAAGIPVVTADSHSPTGPVGRVECSCETEIFRAVGLAYIPPHLRG